MKEFDEISFNKYFEGWLEDYEKEHDIDQNRDIDQLREEAYLEFYGWN